MFQDKYVFAQLTAFLNRTQFNNYVRKYDGNRRNRQTLWGECTEANPKLLLNGT